MKCSFKCILLYFVLPAKKIKYEWNDGKTNHVFFEILMDVKKQRDKYANLRGSFILELRVRDPIKICLVLFNVVYLINILIGTCLFAYAGDYLHFEHSIRETIRR